LGAGLVIIGAGAFLAAVDVFAAARTFAVPVLVTLAGASLIFGPWLLRVGQQLSDERRERIRSQERSEMAAHLHDSVLQTLALIQRSHDARSMSSLARVQERELRAWLYGRTGFAEDETLAGAVNAAAGRTEQMHKVSVETILVGDAPFDDRVQALVHACAEAMNNAARHSGVTVVSVYVEVENDAVTVYVRDQGRGFDVAAVPADRRGIAESIRARMARFGGTATISSSVGEGTEVQLRLPRKSA
jgi:signal transduction histidine kinase